MASTRALSEDLRTFLYMPFMHSEHLADQERCVALFERLGQAENAKYARIMPTSSAGSAASRIATACWGATTTADEQAFLELGGFSG